MKYTITIDIPRSHEWSLSLSESVLFAFLYTVPSWADQIQADGKSWYFASRNMVIDQVPIISDKPDTIYRLFKSLQEKGLINWMKVGDRDYVSLTEKAKTWNTVSVPTLGNKSEDARKKIRVSSEINPTNKNNNTIPEIIQQQQTRTRATAPDPFSTPPPVARFLSLEEIVDECRNDNEMHMLFHRRQVPLELYAQYLDAFVPHYKAMNQTANRKDFRSHFLNWSEKRHRASKQGATGGYDTLKRFT